MEVRMMAHLEGKAEKKSEKTKRKKGQMKNNCENAKTWR